MNLALNEEQELLKQTAKRFFDKECPMTLVRELLESPEGYSPKLWVQMVELGWLSLPIPEAYDGIGGGFLDLAVIFEEMGRTLMPSPFIPTVLLGAYPIVDAGTEGQKADLLPRIGRGELITTMALLDTGVVFNPAAVTMVAKKDAGGYALNGTKLLVPYANVADLILAVVRTNEHDGLSILLVDAKAPGVHVTTLKTVDDAKLCEVVFENVQVPLSGVLGKEGAAWPIIEQAICRAAVAECIQMVASAQVTLDMAVQQGHNRVQFGVPVGTFQAVQHHCSNSLIDIESARLLTWQAAWLITEGKHCAKEVALAKAWVSDAAHRAVARSYQVLGGVGYIDEHDMTLYFRRTTAGETAYGGADYHYLALARALLS